MGGVSVNGAQEQAGRVCLGSAQLGEGQVGTVPAEGDGAKVERQSKNRRRFLPPLPSGLDLSLLFPVELFAGRQLYAFIGSIVDADTLVLDNAFAVHLEQIISIGQKFDRL